MITHPLSLAFLIGIKLEYTGLHGKSGLLFALRSEKADSVRPNIDNDTYHIYSSISRMRV